MKHQKTLLPEPEYEVLEELLMGDNRYRYVKTENGRTMIQLWSSLSKCWRNHYRYEVESKWQDLKGLAERINKHKKPLRGRKRVESSGKQRKK